MAKVDCKSGVYMVELVPRLIRGAFIKVVVTIHFSGVYFRIGDKKYVMARDGRIRIYSWNGRGGRIDFTW